MRVLLCALSVFVLCGTAHAAPRRVVSLDYCADQFVLALADRAQIAAVSRGALRDDSYFRERARGLRQTRGTLEEALALQPDLIVRNWGGPWDAEAAFQRFGIPVLQVGDASSFDVARADLLDAARALGQIERGAVLVVDFDERRARLRSNVSALAMPVMYLSAGGAVAGRGVLLDDVIRTAGGRNVRSAESWAVLPLERMIEAPPALLALGFFDHGRTRMNAWSPARHPVLQRTLANARTVNLPTASIACEAWFALDAAEAIQAALRS
jgi:iron complex transport system substrate-binding protein